MNGRESPVEFSIDLATSADDAELRRLLRENSMPGRMALTIEREPDFFLGATVEGDRHFTVVARAPQGRLIASATLSLRDAWINGARARVGYIGGLRVDLPYRRSRGLWGALYARAQAIADECEARVYYAVVVADNQHARGVIEKRRSWMPTFRPSGLLRTLALPLWRRERSVRTANGIEIRRGSSELLPDIAACLARNYARYQLAPCWDVATLSDGERLRGLRLEDFIVALVGDELVGCVALWNQQGFRQMVVRGYQGAVGRLRWLANSVAPYVGWPRLPAVDERFRSAYLSHFAVDVDRSEAIRPLIGGARSLAFDAGHELLLLGLTDARHELACVARAFGHLEFRSMIYIVDWGDASTASGLLDDRPPFVEVAVT